MGFFLIGAAWALASPYNSAPDELDHTVRAYGAATGQIAPPPTDAKEGTGAIIEAPAGLANSHCWQQTFVQPATCAAEPGGDETLVPMASISGRYPPLYYALVGAPIALSPDWTGIMLARLISAGLCAAFLACALVDVRRWSRYGLAGVGVIAAITPMVTYLSGTINPNSLEIAAGVAFFGAAVPLLLVPAARRSRPLLIHAGVAAIALATLRAAGPLWLLLGVGALLVSLRRATLRDLWSWRELRWWTVAGGGATLLAVVWTLAFDAAKLAPSHGFRESGLQLGPVQTTWTAVQAWPNVLGQAIGVLSWLDVPLPGFVYLIWQGALVSLVLVGFVLAPPGGRLRLGVLTAVAILGPMAMTIYMFNSIGIVTQGRYVLPLLVGVPILAAFLIQEYGVRQEVARSITRLCVWLLLPLQMVALVYTMVRFQSGFPQWPGWRDFNPLAGTWHPPLGSLLPLLCGLAGLIAVGWVTLTSPSGPEPGREHLADEPGRRATPPAEAPPSAASAVAAAVTTP